MTKNTPKRILYVEDEADIQAIVKIAFELSGNLIVEYCFSAADALQKVDQLKPDLFLLDVMMPDMDGPTLLKELRKNPRYKDTPAIFMTAKVQDKDIIEYKQLGVVDIISKPFDPMSLDARVAQVFIKITMK